MLSIPHRYTDTKFLTNIEGFHGTIHKLGRLLKHVSKLRHKSSKIYKYHRRSTVFIARSLFFLYLFPTCDFYGRFFFYR